MAGLDAVSGSIQAQVAAAVDVEIAALAADAEALTGLLDVGSTARATVLKSNGLTDLLQLVGKRVAASLPPDLKPGDQITVQVTSFENGRINLQIVSSDEVSAPSAAAPAATAAGSPAQTTAPPGSSTPPAAGLPATTLTPTGSPASVAPPVAVFVAASVIRTLSAGAESLPRAGTAPPPAAPAQTQPAAEGESAPGPAQAPSAGRPLADAAVAAKLDTSIEARITALRVASSPPLAPPVSQRPTVGPPPPAPLGISPVPPRPSGFVAPPLVRPAGSSAAEPPRITPGSPKPIGQGVASANARFAQISPQAQLHARQPIANAVPIRTRGDAVLAAGTRAPARSADVAVPAALRASAATVPRIAITAEAFRDPAVLLRALRVPVTQTNLASATLALRSPQRIPAALTALERALPDGRSDPRVATLRTIVGFVNRLDPQSPTFGAQIAAYVSHVVDGGESKLATLLQLYAAHADSAAPAAPGAPATNFAQSGTTNTETPTVASGGSVFVGATGAMTSAAPPLAAAQVLVAQAALDHDLKTTLQSIVAIPPSGGAAAAAQTALTALTGVQLDVVSALAQSPQQIAFTIPLPLVHPDARAHVTVDRERPDDRTQSIDGDNFHIAFILTTKHLGTVTIDLRTVGRAVNVGVRTEAELAAKTFGGALARLKDRLETLRYNVTSIESAVAARTSASANVTSEAAPVETVRETEVDNRV